MPDYVLLMHDDIPDLGNDARNDDWAPYISRLQAAGKFQGGSAVGTGICMRKSGAVPPITGHISGYIRVGADSLDHARTLLIGNVRGRWD